MYKCKYFKPHELVSELTYTKFGENCYQFFDEDILRELDIIRETYGRPITINNWFWGGQYKESGLRTNKDSIVKNKTNLYLSAHCLAKGFDLKDKTDISGHNHTLYNHISSLIREGKLKKFRRLENIQKTPTWVHVDAFQTIFNSLVIF